MKKLLLTLATVFLAITASAETVTFVPDGSSYSGTVSTTIPNGNCVGTDYKAGQITINLEKINSSTSNVTGGLIRWYMDDILHITPANGYTVTSVIIHAPNSYSNNKSAILTASGVDVTSVNNDVTNNEMFTWNGSANAKFSIVADKQIRPSAIEVTYTSNGPQKKDAGLAFPKESYQNILGEDFPSPVLDNTNGLAVTYASENAEVATVDASGNVKIVGAGTTTISATSKETDEFAAGYASYTLTVIDPNAPASTEYTILFGPAYNSKRVNNYSSEFNVKVNGEEFAVINNFNNNNNGWDFVRSGSSKSATTATITTINPLPIFVSDIVINAKKNKTDTNDKVTSAKIYISKSNDFAVSEEIDITSYINGLSESTSDVKVTIATPANKMYYKIEFVQPKNSNNGWLETHSVKYIPVPAKMPVVSHNKNQVTITPGEEGAKIYYTVDGSDVDVTKATLYEDPFAIDKTTIVKAVAVVEGKANSAQNEYEAEYIAAPTATYTYVDDQSKDFTFDASSMSLNDITGGIRITITAPEGCALWYELEQNPQNDQHKPGNPIMKAAGNNVNGDVTAVSIVLNKVADGVVKNVLVQTQGKLRFYSENAKGIQSHDVVVNFTGETGVEDIIADENNGEVEFFNLQGVRVANPENGVYIRRQGNKATKVLVK